PSEWPPPWRRRRRLGRTIWLPPGRTPRSTCLRCASRAYEHRVVHPARGPAAAGDPATDVGPAAARDAPAGSARWPPTGTKLRSTAGLELPPGRNELLRWLPRSEWSGFESRWGSAARWPAVPS